MKGWDGVDTVQMDGRYVAPTYARFPVAFARGRGCYLWDEGGKRYTDMGSGIAVHALGHGNRAWQRAVCRQARRLAHVSNLYHSRPQGELAQALCERSGLKKVFFCNSGAEANECAIKVARKYAADRYGEGQRPVVLTLTGSFHGRTLATLAATGQEGFHRYFGPFPGGFRHVPPNDIPALEAALGKGDVCALLVEPIQGEGGVNPLTRAYLQAARRLTEEKDALLLLDEIQTGMGRTGALFAYQQMGIVPDGLTLAKALAGGLPMGACLMGERAQQALGPGDHGSTFGGNPVCAAGALALLRQLDAGLLAQVADKGAYIRSQLEGLDGVRAITGAGLMLGIETEKEPRALVQALLGRGVVALTAKNKLRLLPPLTIPWRALRQATQIIKEEMEA